MELPFVPGRETIDEGRGSEQSDEGRGQHFSKVIRVVGGSNNEIEGSQAKRNGENDGELTEKRWGQETLSG
jgi:hypothetical protein